MAFPLPPWLNVQPALFTQALEAGARAGLAVSEQQQRAFALAEARAERQARDAERQREFEETRLLNVQRLGQDAARLQQQVAHQTAQEAAQQAQESRLLDYNTGQLAVANRRAALDEQQFKAPTVFVPGTNGAPPYVRDPRGNPHFIPGSEPIMPVSAPQDIGGGVKVVRVSPQHLQVLDTGAPKRLPIDVAQEVAWRNADIKAAQALKETLLKAGTRADAPDVGKLDQAIDEHKTAVRLLQNPGGAASTVPEMAAPRTKSERDALATGTRYKGPDGRIYIKK